MKSAIVAVSMVAVSMAHWHDRHNRHHERHAFDGQGPDKPEGCPRAHDFKVLGQACERSAQNYCYDNYQNRDVAGMAACVKKEPKTEPYCLNTFTHKFPALYACVEDVHQYCPELLQAPVREEGGREESDDSDSDDSDDSEDSDDSDDFELRRRLLSDQRDEDPRIGCLESHYGGFAQTCHAAVNKEYASKHNGDVPEIEGVFGLLAVPAPERDDKGDRWRMHHWGGFLFFPCVVFMCAGACVYRRRKRRQRHERNVAHAAALTPSQQFPGQVAQASSAPAHPVADHATSNYAPPATTVVAQGTPVVAAPATPGMYPVLQAQPVAGQHYTIN